MTSPGTWQTPAPRAPRFVAAVSGKGGVGKTNVVANLAVAAAGLGSRVMIVDGDLGLSNVDVLLGLVPSLSVADVLAGSCEVEEALLRGPRGVRILPAASGRQDLAALERPALDALMARIRDAARDCDLVLIDAGAGVGPSVVGLAAACDPVIVVTTGEPTSLADAYATLKVVHRAAPERRLDVLVNAARDERDARRTHRHLERVARRFLAADVRYRGFLPSDPRLPDAVARQRAVVEAFPSAPVSRQLVALAAELTRENG